MQDTIVPEDVLPGQHPMLLTVDVEALPRRAAEAHVQRLIYGRFGERRLGIKEMMTLAERQNFRLTCFFDFCEYDLYGEELLDAAREIADRGHDLELHAHPDFLADETWRKLGVPNNKRLDQFSLEQADALFRYLIDLQLKVSTKAPVAFRGGSYRSNDNIVAAMGKYGLRLSSSHNPGRHKRDPDLGSAAFRHANGILEVPISVLEKGGKTIELNFNSFGFDKNFGWFIPEFQAKYRASGVLNLVMHSKSFLARDKQKKHSALKGNKLLHHYKALLDYIKDSNINVLGADELAQRWAEARATVLSSTTGMVPATGLEPVTP